MQIIEDWLGEINDLVNIDITNIYDNKYRVDVWTKVPCNLVYRGYNVLITQSYFLQADENGVVDKTIAPKPKEDKRF